MRSMQPRHAPPPHLGVRQGHGGQTGIEGVGDRMQVVDAHDRQSVGKRDAAPRRGLHEAHRDLVVETDDRRRWPLLIEQLAARLTPASGVRVAEREAPVAQCDAGIAEDRAHAGETSSSRSRLGGADVGDVAMTRRKEVVAGEGGDLGFVRHDRVHHPPGFRSCVHEDDGESFRDGGPIHLLVVHAGDEQTVHPLREEARHQIRFGRGVSAALADHQQHVVLEAGSAGTLDDAPGERRRGQIVADQADHAGAPAPQTGCHAVGHVPELAGDRHYALAGRRVDGPRTAQCVGDSRRRHACGGGDVGHPRSRSARHPSTPSDKPIGGSRSGRAGRGVTPVVVLDPPARAHHEKRIEPDGPTEHGGGEHGEHPREVSQHRRDSVGREETPGAGGRRGSLFRSGDYASRRNPNPGRLRHQRGDALIEPRKV